ncbi:hypothetical protein BCR42DRAFT_497405 [Absidia repens]|uniref:Uncharacterized protein n=1 Tax=Absidia repens TaxID=90262 RepID=A0A1X2HF90_9FUNG|nr:hypothetical protein BCR42DRAFT_497405 [Absidia repens]
MHMLGLGFKKIYTLGDLYIGERVAKIADQQSLQFSKVYSSNHIAPIRSELADYIDIMRYIIPSLFVPAYSNRSVMNALLSLFPHESMQRRKTIHQCICPQPALPELPAANDQEVGSTNWLFNKMSRTNNEQSVYTSLELRSKRDPGVKASNAIVVFIRCWK